MGAQVVEKTKIRTTYHSVYRYVQRVRGIRNKRDAKRYLQRKGNYEKMRAELLHMFNKADYLSYGHFGRHDNAHFYMRGAIKFIVKDNMIVTLMNPFERWQ